MTVYKVKKVKIIVTSVACSRTIILTLFTFYLFHLVEKFSEGGENEGRLF